MYVQSLATRLSLEKLAGVPYGGFYDDEVKQWLGLENSHAKVALGYACGHGV